MAVPVIDDSVVEFVCDRISALLKPIMAAPVSVFDLAPSAFEDEDTVTDALEYDIGNLTAYDTQPLDPAALAGGRETTLKDMATASTQLLIKHLFQLPVEMSETGPLVR